MTQTTRITAKQLAEVLTRIATTPMLFPDLDYVITTDDKDFSVTFRPLTTEESRPS